MKSSFSGRGQDFRVLMFGGLRKNYQELGRVSEFNAFLTKLINPGSWNWSRFGKAWFWVWLPRTWNLFPGWVTGVKSKRETRTVHWSEVIQTIPKGERSLGECGPGSGFNPVFQAKAWEQVLKDKGGEECCPGRWWNWTRVWNKLMEILMQTGCNCFNLVTRCSPCICRN